MIETTTSTAPPREGDFALRFFLIAVGGFVASAFLAWCLHRLYPLGRPAARLGLPWVFVLTTLLLMVGSGLLIKAATNVRLERQRIFRRSLVSSLICGLLFVAFQSYAMTSLTPGGLDERGAEGVHAFVFVFVFLHAMHFVVANLFLVWVTLKAFEGRYDHEYYWGVSVCGWFWHGLGIVWMLILLVFVFANAHEEGTRKYEAAGRPPDWSAQR